MGLVSSSRANSAATNRAFHLRAAVEVVEISEQREAYDAYQRGEGSYASVPNYEVLGECGHRLAVISGRDDFSRDKERVRIAEGRPRRRRCIYCPKES